MSFKTIRDALSWLLWAKRDELFLYKIVIVDRLSPNGIVEIPADFVERADRNYVYMKDGTVIPVHRVLGIKKGDSYVWKRREGEELP